MRLVPLLVDSAMNMNEEMNAGLFLSLLTPRSFLMLILVEPRACGPPLSVGSIGWIRQVKVNVRSSKDGASPIYLSFSLGSKNEHACYLLYWTFDQAFYPCRIGTNHHCIALEQLSGQQLPYTDIDSFFVTGPTSQPFAGWSEVSLVWKDGIRQRKESARPEQRPTKTVIT